MIHPSRPSRLCSTKKRRTTSRKKGRVIQILCGDRILSTVFLPRLDQSSRCLFDHSKCACVCVCVYVCVYVCAYIDACNVYSTGSDRFSLIIQARQPRGSSRSSRPFFQHLSFFPQLRPLILFHSSNQRRKLSDPDGRLNHTHCLRSCFLPHSSFGFESGRSSSFFFVFYFIFPILFSRFAFRP